MVDITNSVVERIKGKKGITSTARDKHFEILVDSILREMQTMHGLVPNNQPDYLDFLADFAVWRHDNRDKSGAMPPDLRIRLNNYKLRGRQDGGV